MSGRIPICNDPDAEDFTLDDSGTACNFCTLERFKKRETKPKPGVIPDESLRITLRPENNWIKVYLVTEDKYGTPLSEKWLASFMGLTTRCAC